MVCPSRVSKAVAHLVTLVTGGLLLTGTTAGQPTTDTQTSSLLIGERLNLVVLQGQRALNDVRTPTTMMVVVEVRDENYRPLEGATVEFELPQNGPSGSFEGGVRNKTVITNAQGQAFAAFEPNPEPGRLAIQVRATFGSRTGMVTIMQQNIRARSTTWVSRHRTIAIAIAVGVASTATAAILTTRRGASSPSSKPTVTITSGVPTFGSPQ